MNLTLIGMPGVGKSTIGRALSKEMNYNYLDIDELIESREKKPLQKVLSELGDDNFIAIEEKEVLMLKNLEKTIISTGGSIVYSEKAMNHLKNISLIIFLSSSLNKIQSRIKNRNTRGIVGINKKSLESIYDERNKLYKKYADLEVNCEDLNIKKIIVTIRTLIKDRNL